MCSPSSTLQQVHSVWPLLLYQVIEKQLLHPNVNIHLHVIFIQFAENFLNGQPLVFHWSNEQVLATRKRIEGVLLSEGYLKLHHTTSS